LRTGVAEREELWACASWGNAEPGGAATPTLKTGECDQRLVTAIPGTKDRAATARESAGVTEQCNAGMPTPRTSYPRSQAVIGICTLKIGKCDQRLVTAIPGTEDRAATARESAGVAEQRNTGMPTPCTGYPRSQAVIAISGTEVQRTEAQQSCRYVSQRNADMPAPSFRFWSGPAKTSSPGAEERAPKNDN
jgi:hypothetical protein